MPSAGLGLIALVLAGVWTPRRIAGTTVSYLGGGRGLLHENQCVGGESDAKHNSPKVQGVEFKIPYGEDETR